MTSKIRHKLQQLLAVVGKGGLSRQVALGPSGRSRQRPRVENLEDRLCLSGALTLSLNVMTGTVGSPYNQSVEVSGGNAGDSYQFTLLEPQGGPEPTNPSATAGLPPGLSLNLATGEISGTPLAPGAYPFVIEVIDSTQNLTATAAFPLSIGPLITLTSSVSSVGTEYTNYQSGTITASGSPAGPYLFSSTDLPPGLSLVTANTPTTTAQVTGIPTQWGTYTFTVTATDTVQNTGSRTYQVTIEPDMSFAITTDPSRPVAPLANIDSTEVQLTGPDEGTMTPIPFLNNLPVAIQGQSYSQTITVSVPSPNGIVGIDASSENPTYQSNKWNGLTITSTTNGNQGTIVIEGTPEKFTNPGNTGPPTLEPLALTLTATDSNNFQDSVTYLLNVEPGTSPPEVPIQAEINGSTFANLPAGTVGQAYPSASFTIPGNSGFAFSLITLANNSDGNQGLPAGLSFDPDTDSLSGTPTQAGYYNIIVQAVDSSTGVIESRVFSITVNPAPGTLQLSPLVLPLGSPGVPYSQLITAVGAIGDVAWQYSWVYGNAEDLNALGLSIQQAPGTSNASILSGTPIGSSAASSLTLSVTATDSAGHSVTQYYPISVEFTPQQIARAYGFDRITLSGGIRGDGTGQTVAIIDNYDAPNLVSSTDPNFIYSDLHLFDVQFGLPDPPLFLKLDAFGGTNIPIGTQYDTGETVQDVEWVHALAPGANIILLEASPDDPQGIFTALQTARAFPGVSVVSLSLHTSYDNNEYNVGNGIQTLYNEPGLDAVFTSPAGHPVTFVSAAGDYYNGAYQSRYPANSPGVLAVGYTGLALDAGGGYGAEAAVEGGGGGASTQELQPAWQVATAQANSTMRNTPDVTFNGSNVTGVVVYDSNQSWLTPSDQPIPGLPWKTGDGTSIATPSWAALMAIVNQGLSLIGQPPLDGGSQTLPALYDLAGSPAFHYVDTVGDLAGSSADAADVTTGVTAISTGFGSYNPWSGLGSPVANVLVPELIGGLDTITGTVFHDADRGGMPNLNNRGVAGVTVTLNATINGRLVAGQVSTVTDRDGSYHFTVAPGNYTVRIDVPPGDIQVTANPPVITFLAGKSEDRVAVNFGLRTPIPVSVDHGPRTPTPTPAPRTMTPSIVSLERLATRRRHSARFRIVFNFPLDAAVAGDTRNYRVSQQRRSRHSRPRAVAVRMARYDAVNQSVTLGLGRFRPRQKSVLSISGLTWGGIPTPTIVATLG